MNKVFTIGRDPSCDIVIFDATDVVSRVHASLKVKRNGKYVLIDQSRNGTYVNGIKMSSNEEIPVTRKDVISFAHVKDLDWNQVPREKDSKMIWILIAITVIVVACIGYFIFRPKNEPVRTIVEGEELPVEIHEIPIVKDTAVKETIYVNPKPIVKPKPKKEKPEEKNEETPAQEEGEQEVVNPLL